MPLSEEEIERAEPGVTPGGRVTTKPYKMGDSGGLYIEVPPSGRKRWRMKYRYGGKQLLLAFGVYPDVSLSEARANRDVARAMLADGTNPGEYVKAQRAAKRDEQVRQLAATRFMLDSNGALYFRLGNRCLTLTPIETSELRGFLDATRDVNPKVPLCR